MTSASVCKRPARSSAAVLAVACTIHRNDRASEKITLTCRINIRYRSILHYALRQLLAASSSRAAKQPPR
jgi:hypothetical protein